MPRIIYLIFGTQTPRGGHKMAVRHVEALHRLGYPAVAWVPAGASSLTWLHHEAPVEPMGELRDGDIIVIPEDALNGLKHFAKTPQHKVVFCQNQFFAAANGIGALEPEEAAAYRDYMACSHRVADWLQRFVPHASVAVVPGFADERMFKPLPKALSIAYSPSKRPMEARAIRYMTTRLFTGRQQWRWNVIQGQPERGVAAILGQATIFLSLCRFEALGLTILEAMAAGCLPVGFTGLGTREYTSAVNGFWIEEDDCEACAEALVKAVALAETNPTLVARMSESARQTAAAYTYEAFVTALDGFWRPRMAKP